LVYSIRERAGERILVVPVGPMEQVRCPARTVMEIGGLYFDRDWLDFSEYSNEETLE
jgi:hypothetical protein